MCAKRKESENKKQLIFSNEFYSDLETDDMLYAVLIRSPVSAATLISISHPNLPEGYRIFSAEDIIGKKTITTLDEKTPVFCMNEIRYIGEPLGILVGKDEKLLRELLNDVEIRYEERMSAPKRLLAERIIQVGEDVDQAFQSPDIADITEETWSAQIRPNSCTEPTGAFCFFREGLLHVFTPSQWLSHLRKSLSDVTGIEIKKIIITRTQFSELDTNMLWINSLIATQVAISAIKTGKPVKLVLSRAEQQQFIENTAPVTITHKTAINKAGEITAADVSITVDGGAYNPFAHEFIDRLCIASCNIYCPKSVRISGKVYSSEKPPYSVDLATIDSHAIYAMESQLQKIAEKTDFSPLELRQINNCTNGNRTHLMPFFLNCENIEETLQAVSHSSDFNRKYVSYHLNEKSHYLQNNNSPFAPPLRGAGLACGFSGSGYNGTAFFRTNPSLEVTLTADGKVQIHALPPSPSVWSIWRTIAANILKTEKSKIILNSNFETEKEPEAPETIHSNISIMTLLLESACESLRRKKDSSVLPLTIKKTLSNSRKTAWDREHFSGFPFKATAFGACVVDVELDPCTYRENLRGIWVVVDAGKIFSAKAAESSVKAAIQQTLRELVEDDTVRCDNIRVQFIQSTSEPKQIGDIVYSLLPAAFAMALSQALAITITRLPIQNDTLYKLSQKAKHLFDKQRALEQTEKSEKSEKESAEKQEQTDDPAQNQQEASE
ncbi:MAG: xanthine dehydrogenase family protein [Treponema sp.]|nr:xanthine dehydrogenase family protein [Treponema sp.]